jgi:putative N6-adenine-specific DNA methylase
MHLQLAATCGLGLEDIVATELRDLGMAEVKPGPGAVEFTGTWEDVWWANLRLRAANRVLVELGGGPARDGDDLAAGARALFFKRGGLELARVLVPERSFAVHATVTGSTLRDARWAALRFKDGLVDAQRQRFGSRSSVEREDPDVALRLRVHHDQATLFLDTSGLPLDRRGYRVKSVDAPLREQLAAACVLASGWDGQGPVVDPMCGSGTLLVEAASFALSASPQRLRSDFAFMRLPGFDRRAFEDLRRVRFEPLSRNLQLFGRDQSPSAIAASRANLEVAGLSDQAVLEVGDAFAFDPPPGPGLLVINPAYGERLAMAEDFWPRLGDLMKQRYRGYRAVVIAGDAQLGKTIGLKSKRRWPVWNGPIEARILVFELY